MISCSLSKKLTCIYVFFCIFIRRRGREYSAHVGGDDFIHIILAGKNRFILFLRVNLIQC